MLLFSRKIADFPRNSESYKISNKQLKFNYMEKNTDGCGAATAVKIQSNSLCHFGSERIQT